MITKLVNILRCIYRHHSILSGNVHIRLPWSHDAYILMIIQKPIDPPWNDFGFQGFRCLICCSTTYSCQCIADNINQGTCKMWHNISGGRNLPDVPIRLFNSLYILQIMETQVVVKLMNIFVTEHAVVTDMNSMSSHSKYLIVVLHKKNNIEHCGTEHE